ncbi:MAG: flagellar assembly protein FliH [Campylobacter sp.]|nr:flagellar assembly protein FliH [Campylobacter sp.]
MRSSVITSKESESHFVANYRFKVLGSQEHNRRASDKIATNSEPKTSEEEVEKIDVIPQEAPIPQASQETEQSPKFDSGFVEELLKKTDELSSNIIKLQMQIENQENEFNNRLQAEIARAKEDGIAEGKAQADEKFQAEISQLNEKFNSSIAKLTDFYNKLEEFLQKSEGEMADAAIKVAKEVIQKEITANSSAVAFSLSKALMNQLKDAKNITLRLNPADTIFVGEKFAQNPHIKIQADDAISKGGVVIISDVGNIEGSVENRLEKLKSSMK